MSLFRGVVLIAALVLVVTVSSGQSCTGIQNTTTDSEPAQAASLEPRGFLSRFIEAYRQDWNGVEQPPEQPRRIPPPPLNSPPFPSADWNYGGSSVIGAWAMTLSSDGSSLWRS